MSRAVFSVVHGVLLLGVLAGCDSATGLRLDDYDQIPRLPDLDYQAVQPALAYDYWELRWSFGPPPDSIVGYAGTKQKEELDSALVAAFDAVHVDFGFAAECLPAYCYKYVASIRRSNIETWQTTGELVSFLGAIDAPEEAILLADAHEYGWGSSKEIGAIKTVEDGYKLVVLKMVSFCDPIQTNRIVLHISDSGVLAEIISEVWEKEDGVCI